MSTASYSEFIKNPPKNFSGTKEVWQSFAAELLSLESFAMLHGNEAERHTLHALKLFTEYQEGKEALAVDIREEENTLICAVALSDRPFIINTILENLLTISLKPTIFLHPILKSSRGLTSLSLFVIPRDTSPLSAPEHLREKLHAALTQLISITTDYSKIVDDVRSAASLLKNSAHVQDHESSELLSWLIADGLIFLGTQYDGHCNGIAGNDLYKKEIAEDTQKLSLDTPLLITKLSSSSRVHRLSRPLHICAQLPNKKTISIIGLLTSKAKGEESTTSPVIRKKFESLVALEKAPTNSFTYKSIVNLINNMPTEDALRASVSALRDTLTSTIISHSSHLVRIALIGDIASRETTVLVIIPRDRFSTAIRKKLQCKVEEHFKALQGSSDYRLDVSDKSLSRFYFSVPTTQETLISLDRKALTSALLEITEPWSDSLRRRLDPASLAYQLADQLPAEYQALSTIEQGTQDLEILAATGTNRLFATSLKKISDVQYLLSIASFGKELTISRVTPVLENAGFEVITQEAFGISSEDEMRFLYRYEILPRQVGKNPFDESRVAQALEQLLAGAAANDPLNALLLQGLGISEIQVLRAYTSLLSQLNKFATRHAIFTALSSYPKASIALWKIFEIKFSPLRSESSIEKRLEACMPFEEEFKDVVRAIKDLAHDRILRAIFDLVKHTVRTNAFIPHSALALKIASEKCDLIPLPRPKFEIFVLAQHVEGVHLRTALVSRGGIRWSDRKDDYRTEVLGLVKTQKVKNVVIIPSGSKGGFFVKVTTPDGSPVARPVVEQCYQDYIRALLSVTDNLIHGKPVTPTGVIRHDDTDPYLVVAADKGTATFSDLANRVAVDEYKFWLGDAFASGGSQGYDHKKYGITAKGVWECTKRHFSEAGIDYTNAPFTLVGIGDMSGDVFGNGLLLSDQAKLLAAFDHRSIFIDPSPDPKKSFAERKRLFELKGSSWNDYTKSLISKGGGIFGRNEKEIILTPEMRTALGIAKQVPSVIPGEELVVHILKAPVDLIWNGGIGTYIKSKEETNSEVNDSSNDLVRINGDEVRAKVIGEGGNLGVTPKGRRDFALIGGHINTDAIDNSAGVDLSDHEVNLKILLSGLETSGKLARENRNTLLKEIGEDVAAAVLKHNATQALTLSLGVHRSKRNIDYYRTLVNFLAREGYINRSIDPLPDDDEFAYRGTKGEGLTRPELALCLACTKMWVKDELLKTTLPHDPALEYLAFNYFPQKIRSLYPTEISKHPLKSNIIATELSNLIVDTFGISFVHRLFSLYGNTVEEVIRAAIISYMLFDGEKLLQESAAFDKAYSQTLFMKLQFDIRRMLRAAASWFLTEPSSAKLVSIQDAISDIAPHLTTLKGNTKIYLDSRQRTTFESRYQEYRETTPDLAWAMALSPSIISVLELVGVARSSSRPFTQSAALYLNAIETLGVSSLVTLGAPLEVASRWENELRLNSFIDIRRAISKIARTLIEKGKPDAESLKNCKHFGSLTTTMKELVNVGYQAAGLAVIARNLNAIAEEIAKA